MYEQFYGFYESPFNITPYPRFLYLSSKHREALDHLLFGIQQRKGFIQITGEVGTGKTTICRALLEELGPSYKTALILNPCMTGPQMLRTILTEFKQELHRNDRVAWLEALNRFLLDQVHEGNDVVLVIDEAQDLSPDLMEQVRLLSNLETDQQKLLQIVLIGQPELRPRLDREEMRQLRQRITVRYHLGPIGRQETEAYILHRLLIAGSNGRPTFSRSAFSAIHRYAGGVPRLINAVCDKALLCGFVQGRDSLGWWQIRRAIRDLEGQGW